MNAFMASPEMKEWDEPHDCLNLVYRMGRLKEANNLMRTTLITVAFFSTLGIKAEVDPRKQF